jgi:hypothetical protein
MLTAAGAHELAGVWARWADGADVETAWPFAIDGTIKFHLKAD